MSKISVKAKLISADEILDIQVSGIKINNKIVYKENNITVTLIIYKNKIEMNRVCNEYNIHLIFENDKMTMSTYNVFGTSKTFELETISIIKTMTDKHIEIDYELEGNKFSYSLLIGG